MRAPALLFAALLLTACAPVDEATPPSGPTAVDGVPCTKDDLTTLAKGKFTFGTDQPVYPPWYQDDDPTSGKGFESAVAYAVAEQLGYAKADVAWVRVPFNAAIQPGAKTYDANLTEFSITEERKQAVDFSAPYYTVAQAVIALKTAPVASAKSVEELRKAKIGAQVGTTSFTAAKRLVAEQDIAVYNTNDDAKAALRAGQVEALVVDLPTAFFITSAEMEDAAIVGQIPAGDGKPEQFGIVLDKGSKLTGCVSTAVEALRSRGRLAEIETQWLTTEGKAPELK
ncbi:ABC transporter substrate-binding protein [Umezawaea sp. Da 62-37]|uniref:ABC transporter substrate-binding protein n=1 Tax=Umezawaea sp. Da 62-37 TaxID=3075927 RepID=UPI0028F74E57|nr:ABC transporter substrate-binding protein [Umezawaea sp. Da 62-37]WNV91208.1 ABC transporter substrate-binding protein [Umezawaea sp. Da 62-37]